MIAPKGSIFNPSFPRATKARFCQIQRMADFTLQALAPAIPEKITAGNSASTTFLSYSGFQPENEEYWIYLEVNEGSHGGKQGADGGTRWTRSSRTRATTRSRSSSGATRCGRSATSCVTHDPPGKWRGGIGTVRVNRFLADTIVACEGDRFFGDPPWGIFGGHPGMTSTLRKNPDAPSEEHWPSKFTNQRLLAGEAIEITVPCSGGYGDPVERDAKLVLDDVLDGFTSLEQAQEIYLVAIDAESLTLDEEETAAAARRGRGRHVRAASRRAGALRGAQPPASGGGSGRRRSRAAQRNLRTGPPPPAWRRGSAAPGVGTQVVQLSSSPSRVLHVGQRPGRNRTGFARRCARGPKRSDSA